ncbi:MAG: GNAT family N-acetyltransferase [Nocardiopsaceae bacterium]|jgi:GNAT superfamily N-acetyltransferase|nr:GNAT family N-acetyltransferase [Nocardiopsaceae bacterium]
MGPSSDATLDWRAEVDQWWAEVLRLPVSAVRSGRVYALDHVDHVGVVSVDGSAAQLIYGPPKAMPALHAAVAGNAVDLADGGRLAAAIGPGAGRVLGPAWYGYVTARTLRPLLDPAVRPLTEMDLPELARLRDRTPQAEREESGTTGLPAFGYLHNGELLAVACLGVWHGMPTIGVLTDPQARGRGLARLVVTAAAREGLSRRAVVQYRAWHRNSASIAVAARCGFEHYCDSLVIEFMTKAR